MATMIAARLHAYGSPMTLDRIEVPEPRPTDVLVEVKACGVVPNLARVVSNFFGSLTPDNKMMPPLPAIFGLDPTGVVAKVGAQVFSIRPGDRVYVNPARSCGSCKMCRSGKELDCPSFTLQGYFGRSQDIMRAYPYGGLAQFITAPATALVKLPDNLSFEAAARLGYFGTAYSAMKKIGVGPGQTLLDQRHQRAARTQRRAARAGDGRDKNSRHRPQAGAARSREGTGAATHRRSFGTECAGARRGSGKSRSARRVGAGRRPKAMASTA